LWFFTRDKTGRGVGTTPHIPTPHVPTPRGDAASPLRDRRGKTLFIDARKLGILVDRVHRDLTDDDIAKIAGMYHAWKSGSEYSDVPGFCKSTTLDEIRAQGYVLTPGRYVGVAEMDEDNEPFEEKMKRLTEALEKQFTDNVKLEERILQNLKGL
jgi:type I restriction enzyme M protein